MDRKKRIDNRKNNHRKHTSLLPFLILILLIIIGSTTYLLSKKGILKDSALQFIPRHIEQGDSRELVSKTPVELPTTHKKTSIQEPSSLNSVNRQENEDSPPLTSEPTVEIPPTLLAEVQRDLDIILSDTTPGPATSATVAKENQCSQSAQIVKNFYIHLDKQPYLKSFKIGTTSSIHFTRLIQDLLDHPPIVSRETDDLFNILQNTAHFFRIIGKDNILLLKGILNREKNYFENVLNHFYTITTLSNCPQKSFNLSITKDSLYEYAGFFLNTMGGRLYLFRRDSVSRMTVNFYAILLIDQANREENNKDGILLQPAIDTLITEIEASYGQLKFKDIYLDTLYDLKVRYQ